MAATADLPLTLLLTSRGVSTAYALRDGSAADLPLVRHPIELATLPARRDASPQGIQGLATLGAGGGGAGGQGDPSRSLAGVASTAKAALDEMAIIDTSGAQDVLRVVVNTSGSLTIR